MSQGVQRESLVCGLDGRGRGMEDERGHTDTENSTDLRVESDSDGPGTDTDDGLDEEDIFVEPLEGEEDVGDRDVEIPPHLTGEDAVVETVEETVNKMRERFQEVTRTTGPSPRDEVMIDFMVSNEWWRKEKKKDKDEERQGKRKTRVQANGRTNGGTWGCVVG